MSHLLSVRRAGTLLHPFSLPGAGYTGTLGAQARRFADLLADAGLQIWQVLPLGPTHDDGCPYQAFSVHAGNPDLIDLDWLVERGWLARRDAVAGRQSRAAKARALRAASARYFRRTGPAGDAHYREFRAQADHWLESYVRFRAFRDQLDGLPWTAWPAGLRHCDAAACDARAAQLGDELDALRFGQFVFECQWRELREYANARGIGLFGDMPIFVHLESADVWAHQDLFQLDAGGRPLTVTGVPPDYFSAEGQLWGNPQYDWARMQQTGFAWWLQRFTSAQRQFDVVRIDHFRALQAYWEVPAGATSAKDGRWVAAPGRELLAAVRAQCPELCLVAENLGTITPEVEALRTEFALPGMLILQFAFDGSPDNPYLSHRHGEADIVYTGTHDNDTTLGWFESLDAHTRAAVYRYFGDPDETMPWLLIRQALASRANTAIVPWQDFLGLDGHHRMNTPGTREGNWQWRFRWEQVPEGLAQRIRGLLAQHGRLPASAWDAGYVTGVDAGYGAGRPGQ